MEWVDNIDSYICPVCGFETNNPNRFNKICPSCGFVAERDKPEARFVELLRADKEGRVVVYDTREEAEEALRRAENA